MITENKSIFINAPIQKIFDYLKDPRSMLEWWSSFIVDVRDVQQLPNGGTKFQWTGKMVGMRLDGSSEDTEVIPNSKLVTKTTSGIESSITWTLEPSGSGTRLNAATGFSIHIPVLGKLAEAVVVKLNGQGWDKSLASIKTHMEA